MTPNDEAPVVGTIPSDEELERMKEALFEHIDVERADEVHDDSGCVVRINILQNIDEAARAAWEASPGPALAERAAKLEEEVARLRAGMDYVITREISDRESIRRLRSLRTRWRPLWRGRAIILPTDATKPEAGGELAELSAKATPGPWEEDSVESEGGHGRFKAYAISGPDGKVICDTHNSDVILLHEEYDEDGHVMWDETGRNDMRFICALVNAYRAGQLREVDQ